MTLNPVIEIEGIELHLARPVEEIPPWIGQREVLLQLLAAWSLFADDDVPLNPRLLGKPGVGKTTLACAAARELEREIYIVQATTHFDDPKIIAEVSSGLGSPMRGLNVASVPQEERLAVRGW